MARLPLVSPLERALFLKAQPYLFGVASNVLSALASHSHERFFPAGSWLRPQPRPVDTIWFLGEGAVEVYGRGVGPAPTRTVEAPGAVGLAHRLAASPVAPPVRAQVDTLALELGADDLDAILEDHFSLLHQIGRTSCYQACLALRALGDHRPSEDGFPQAPAAAGPLHLDLVQILSRAKQAPLFRGTNLTVLSELIRHQGPEPVAKGEAVWRAGDPIDRVALVFEGGFHSEGPSGHVAAPAGAVLGAWEILLDGPHFEGWVAEAPAHIVSIPRELFVDLLEDHFEFAQLYLRQVSRRIVSAWELLDATGPAS